MLPPIAKAMVAPGTVPEREVPSGWPGHLVPNFSAWLPGDVVLVASDGSKAGKVISSVQRARTSPDAAMLTHAALYVGQGLLVDATYQDQVALRSVWFYAAHRALLLRRLPARSFPATRIARIAEVAKQHVGSKYALSEAVRSVLVPRTAPDPDHLYCSTFVGLVLARATGVLLWERAEHLPLHPGTLATHPGLVTVPAVWCELGRASRFG